MTAVRTIGIMTGNSLDGVDIVLTGFENGRITDLGVFSKPYPRSLTEKMLRLRARIREEGGRMERLVEDGFSLAAIDEYTSLVAETVNTFLPRSGCRREDIAALGFHGQTCDHFPPSIAGGEPAYTVQVGNAGLLADLTGIPVICDFRSDDIMAGGEGAPLAPVHNLHIAGDLRNKGVFPVAFCNAGNTGNISVITEDKDGKNVVRGWDVGPFNHYTDYLVRTYKGQPYDDGGRLAAGGRIVPELLRDLFDNAAVDGIGRNFYLQTPPKSSDPSWYRLTESLNCRHYSFADTLRTALYLSSYAFVHSLSFVPADLRMPADFLVFGGGWKNPLALNDFKCLLRGEGLVLPEHQETFAAVQSRFERPPSVEWSDKFGYSGQYMEARIFADMAYCRIVGKPFTFPESSGCRQPVVGGVYILPSAGGNFLLTGLLETYGTAGLNMENPAPKYWNRAVKGWQKRR